MASHGASSDGDTEDAHKRVQDLQIDDQYCYQSYNASDSDFESIEDDPFQFTDLPYDIRARIYEIFFGMSIYKLPQPESRRIPTPYIGPNSTLATSVSYFNKNVTGRVEVSRRLTAHDKVSLLLANKSIHTEASPFYHRLHWFCIPLRHDGCAHGGLLRVIPGEVLPVFRKLSCISLVYEDPLRDSSIGTNVASYIGLLDHTCSHLKQLSVEVKITKEKPPSERISIALEEIWPRLDFLRVCVLARRLLKSFPWADRIAPGMRWTRAEADYGPHEACSQLSKQRKLRKNVFWTHRHNKEVDQK